MDITQEEETRTSSVPFVEAKYGLDLEVLTKHGERIRDIYNDPDYEHISENEAKRLD